MSEIALPDNDELYRKLGLEELLVPESFAEDPILNAKDKASLRTTEGFRQFFLNHDYQGSPAEGYGHLAKKFVNQLDIIANALKAEDERQIIPTNLTVALKPSATFNPHFYNALSTDEQIMYVEQTAANPERIYEIEETPASRAFRVAIDSVLRVQEPKISSGPGEALLYAGRFHDAERGGMGRDVHLWLLEEIGQDGLGTFRTMELRTHEPPGFTHQTREMNVDKPFETTDELARKRSERLKDRMPDWNFVLDGLIELSEDKRKEVIRMINRPIDEPKVIESLINRLAS